MTNEVSASDSNLEGVRAVASELGVNLLLYSDIERILKIVLPFVRRTSKPESSDPYAEMKQLLSSKETMGPLIEQLKKSLDAKDPDAFDAYVTRILDNRNELIHGFRTLPFGRLADAADCEQALAYLKDRRAYAAPLLQLVVQLATNLSEAEADAERTGLSQSAKISLQAKVFGAP